MVKLQRPTKERKGLKIPGLLAEEPSPPKQLSHPIPSPPILRWSTTVRCQHSLPQTSSHLDLQLGIFSSHGMRITPSVFRSSFRVVA